MHAPRDIRLMSSVRTLMSGLPEATRPDSLLAWRKNAIGIERVFHQLIQLQHCAVVPAIGLRNLIHERDVRAVFAVACRSGLVDQNPEQLARLAGLFRIRSV